VTRPAGDPGAVGAAARGMGAAAGALRDVRAGLRGITSFVVVAGAWRGPASEAFQVDAVGLQTGLDRSAEALDQAAGALAELAARLEHAQATWDQARRLAATAGVGLNPDGGIAPPTAGQGGVPPPTAGHRGVLPPAGGQGGVLPPPAGLDPAAMAAAGQAARLAAAANHEAAAARRTAAARLDRAATLVPAARAGSAGPLPSGHGGRTGLAPPAGGNGERAGSGHGAGEDLLRRVVGRALEAGAEVAKATHHLAAAAEARVEAAGRLAATADDPAVRSAAARVVDTAGRPVLDGRMLHALPLVAPVLDLAAGIGEGQPLPRALAGAIGGAVGADVGSRVGLAVCGGQAAATQGVGAVVCPTVTAVGGAVGSYAGKETALHLYDKIAGPPDRPRSSP
jgi:hypothetical protein